VDISVLNTLLERGKIFPHQHKWYYLFAKNGFANSVKKLAKEDKRIRLVSLGEMINT